MKGRAPAEVKQRIEKGPVRGLCMFTLADALREIRTGIADRR